jgi:hypothetical protein
MRLDARQLLNTPRDQIWNLEDIPYEIIYEDGSIVPSQLKHIIFNRYCWELISLYPQTPLTAACDIKTFLGDGYFNGDTHVKLLEQIFNHICLHNRLNFYYEKESLLRATYQTVNIIYNELIQRISPYVSTIDATDFVNLVKDDRIREIHGKIKATPEHVETAYKEIKDYVNNAENNNRFVFAYRSKAINENQANQCIGPRGFVTDLDRTVFKQPIMNGFIRGMGNLYEIITESRTAAKSLNANDTHIKTSEYASRRIQLLTMSVTGVVPGDCGSTEYYDLFVTQPLLENMKGKYYLKPDTNTLDYIRGNETHLVNTIVKIRTAFGCKTHDSKKICTTCLGKVSENFKENTNLGYVMTAFLMEKLTQAILSTKHLTHSVKKSLIHLEGSANKYFYTDEENNIYFNKDLDLTGLQMILPNSKLSKLVDVLNLPHTNISLTKVGELELIGIRDTKIKTPVQESINIAYRDRFSVITKPLLEYIKSVKLESDSRGNFVIPLDTFNKEAAVFYNPLKETNIISFVNRVASMVETNKDKITDPYDKYITLFNTVIEQFKCNMSVIEVIVYATTAYNPYTNNFKLGRNSEHTQIANKSSIFRHRSLSGLLCYEDQSKELLTHSKELFSNVNRLDHPMDALFCPSAIVK